MLRGTDSMGKSAKTIVRRGLLAYGGSQHLKSRRIGATIQLGTRLHKKAERGKAIQGLQVRTRVR